MFVAIEQTREAGRGEKIGGHADRHPIGLADRLQHKDARLRLEPQQCDDLGWCIDFATLNYAMPGLSLLSREVGTEAGALANGIADERILHERTVAAHDPHKTTLRQLRDRAPRGVAMHAKSPRNLCFGQKAIAWPERTVANLGLQSFHDLTPECDTGIVLQIHVRPPQGRDRHPSETHT